MSRNRQDNRQGNNRGNAPLKGGRCWLYGKHAVLAAVANPNRVIHRVLVTKNTLDALNHNKKELVDPREIERLFPLGTVHQGIAAEVDNLRHVDISEIFDSKLVVILDQVTDPHNVGAILRSCAAFGAGGVIVHDRHSPEEGAVLAKSASGALETVPLVSVTNISSAMEELKEKGFWCVGLDGSAKTTLSKIPDYEKVALVLGAEGQGIRRLVMENCDLLAKVPINDSIESLNVSNAAAVALYELTRD